MVLTLVSVTELLVPLLLKEYEEGTVDIVLCDELDSGVTVTLKSVGGVIALVVLGLVSVLFPVAVVAEVARDVTDVEEAVVAGLLISVCGCMLYARCAVRCVLCVL